jgi:hypothetical protein
MPDKVGVSLSSGEALLLVPLTFTNTGAPRTVNHVTHVTATMHSIVPSQPQREEVSLHWRFELTTVGKWQYFLKYPEQKKDEGYWAGTDDVVEYVGRAFPFALYGGTSATKLFDFIQDGSGFQGSLRRFELVVRAETPSGRVSSKKGVTYICNEATLTERYLYCSQQYE